MNIRSLIILIVVVLVLITLPFLIAAVAGGSDYVFVGFLINPVDGATYLAKMRQGWVGDWMATLAYTPEQGSGAFLFPYYYLLGHAARWTGIPLIVMFHLSRIVGAVLLILALSQLLRRAFPGRPEIYQRALWLAALGSGLGWSVIFSGYIPADFFIAEMYPFLTMMVNPHFPLGLAVLLRMFSLLSGEVTNKSAVELAVLSLVEAMIVPFGIVIIIVVSGAAALWGWLEDNRLRWLGPFSASLSGGLMLLYQYWVTHTDPLFSIWNAQNITSSPPVWDTLLSLSPALPLALLGLWFLRKMVNPSPAARILALWFVAGLLLTYFPFALQRRFMMGLFIPAVGLAAFAIAELAKQRAGWSRLVLVVFLLSLPSNLLLVLGSLLGAQNHPPQMFISQDELSVLGWIENTTPPDALVLAAPDTGLFIPAFTGRRVLYGHPFETLNAQEREEEVVRFFSGASNQLLAEWDVDFIFYGPRERDIGGTLDESGLTLQVRSGDVRLYSVESRE